jgi:hypothetical protein
LLGVRFIDRLLGRSDADARGGGMLATADGPSSTPLDEPHRADA